MNAALDPLRRVVGEGQLLIAAEDLARYDCDGRSGGGSALAVVRPRDTAEVSALMRAAAQAGIALVPQGARTGLAGAGLADGAVVLSLERLSGAPVIDPVNRTAHVEAGVTLSTLEAAAAPLGLTFPVDLGADPSIGGMVVANTGGARFLRYGDVRRNLLALEVVLADRDGTVLQLGAPVWKDNGGLDLKQLFASSSGSLGIVTAATLALQPRPAHRVCALVALSSADRAPSLLVELEAVAGALLSAFEGISGAALDLALAHVPRLRDPFPGRRPDYCILIELSGGGGVSEALLGDLLGAAVAPLLERGDASDAVIDPGDSLWAVRHAIPEGLRAAGRVIACDVAVPRGDVPAFREAASHAVRVRWPELVVADFGHAGDGGLHLNVVWPHAAGPIPHALPAAVHDIVFALAVERFGGSFSAEHGIGPRNIDHYARFTPAAVRSLAGRVQRLIAPNGLGRVDFGAGLENMHV